MPDNSSSSEQKKYTEKQLVDAFRKGADFVNKQIGNQINIGIDNSEVLKIINK